MACAAVQVALETVPRSGSASQNGPAGHGPDAAPQAPEAATRRQRLHHLLERRRPPRQGRPALEHGAFADGSSWNGVIADLRADGYPVVAAALRTVLDHVKGPKILVGHSYGGNVISQAATDDPEVKALVYVAAFLPAPGESALELTEKYPGSKLPGTLDPVTYQQADGSTATDLYIQQDKFPHQFAADVPGQQAALMGAEQRPIAQAALEEKATTAAWKTKPSWDIVTTRDLNIPAAVQRFMAERAHAHTTEVAASHSVAVSHPHLVADVIERAARATVR
ncbi:alpha/beta hydrolase [Streptomyces canus]|uniref:alpha/beta fold hydrolase n=1 Tax=Streptomyces canus TaxID=58343 RepID=UPI002E2C3210|nr:alpha/beta hydrolase [Streptomyces canus]